MTENKDALEPCPFCGAVATVCIGRASDDSALAFVTCGTCGVNGMNFKNSYAPVSEAIAAWNRRPTPPVKQDAMLEALDLNSAFLPAARAAADAAMAQTADEFDINDSADAQRWMDARNGAWFALSAPNVAGVRDYTRERIAELVAEGDGFWRPCSGCQESVDGCVSTTDYPFSEQFQCQPGGGCGECGGIGVIWDTTDYEDMARFSLSTPQPESVEATVERVAHALWLNEAIRAAPNVARNRTIEAFRSELNDRDRIVWLDAANAALSAMNTPPATDEDANLSGDFPC